MICLKEGSIGVVVWISLLVGHGATLTIAGSPLRAFPGAEGFGAYSIGGRGGAVCIVDTLEDYHPKGAHGMGSLLRTNGNVSFHHNFYAHHNARSPRPGTYGEDRSILLDFRNNVIYNWAEVSGYSAADPVRMNYVANYIKPGPSSRNRTRAFSIGGETTVIFAKDNLLVDGDTRIEGGWELIAKGAEVNRAERSFLHGTIVTQSPAAAMVVVLNHGGASLPRRDAVDARLVEEFRESGGKIIDTPDEVGNWPLLEAGAAAIDSDRDGMPDAWEAGHGLDPHDGSDHASKLNAEGITKLEEYLNDLIRSPAG